MSIVEELANMGDDASSSDKQSQSRQSPSHARANLPAKRPLIPYEHFPVDCLSPGIAEYVQRAAASIGCDPVLIALPVLAVLAAAIGASRVVEIKPGFWQPAILWTAPIAESGSGKSPGFNVALNPYYEIEGNLHKDYAEECERIRMAHENLPKSDRKETEPDYPPLPRLVIGDATIEAIAPILSNNSNGTLLAAEELSGWVGSFNQYKGGRGSDRSHWLCLYDGARLIVDRKTGPVKTIIVPRAVVSITGGIQPGVLRRALSDDDFDSGLPARLVFAMPPDEPLGWSDVPMPSPQDYQSILQTLIEGRKGEPVTIPISDDSRALFRDAKNEDVTRLRNIPGPLRAAWAKSCGRAARIALILHCADRSDQWSIGPEVMQRAFKLSRWFDRETERIYHALGLSQSSDSELISIIEEMGTVTPRDLMQWRRSRFPTADVAERELLRLTQEGLLTQQTDRTTGGRPRTVFFWNHTTTEHESG